MQTFTEQRQQHDELTKAFNYLERNGFAPTWVGGLYVLANVPGIRLGTNGQPNTRIYTTERVTTLRGAIRLVQACN